MELGLPPNNRQTYSPNHTDDHNRIVTGINLLAEHVQGVEKVMAGVTLWHAGGVAGAEITGPCVVVIPESMSPTAPVHGMVFSGDVMGVASVTLDPVKGAWVLVSKDGAGQITWRCNRPIPEGQPR